VLARARAIAGPSMCSLVCGALLATSCAGPPDASITGPGPGSTRATAAALSIDAQVSGDSSSAKTTVAVPAFSTTSPNELLLAFVSADQVKAASTTVTAVAGGGLSWALVRRTNAQKGTAEIWRAFAPSPLSAVTVTATLSQAVASSLVVLSFTGVDTSGTGGSGAIGAVQSGSADPGAPTATLVTTRNGSWVFGVGNDWDTATARTPGPGQSLVHQYFPPVGDTYWVQMMNAPTGLSGTSVTLDDTAPATDRYNLSLVEVLPATGSPPTYAISGTITPATGGTTVALTQGTSTLATTSADASGNYSFQGLASGTYTVTPSQAGYTFTPLSQSVTVSGADLGGVNFTANVIPAMLSAIPAGVALSANQGGGNPAAVTVQVNSTSGGSVSFAAAADSAWITVAPASGTTPAAVTLSASIAGLAVGVYTGNVVLTPSSGSPATIGVTLSVGVATDWITIDHDPARTGKASDETTLSASNVSELTLAWSTGVDGNVTAQPLFLHAVQVAGQTRDVLVIGTGGNSLYALDAGSGSVLWTRNFGASTPNTWGLPDGFGIEAPPYIDRAAGRLYTVSTDGAFHVISLVDGTDVYPALALIVNPVTNKVWGGLNRIGNSIYVASASNGGDIAPWRGQVYQVNVSAAPQLVGDFVVVPSIAAPNGGGGIWGYGGVSADWATGNVYAATSFDSVVSADGNENTALYSNSMVALGTNLNLLGYFQGPDPSSIPCDGAPCDLDFASTPTVFAPSGCPTLVAAGSKNGNLYVFRAADLAASGAPLEVLTLNAPNDSLGSGGVGGVPAWDPATNSLYVTDAGPGVSGVSGGVVALTVGSDCVPRVAWSEPLGGSDTPNSTPTVANGLLFVGEGVTGIVHAYDESTGTELWHSGTTFAGAATFAAPVVAGGKLYVGSWQSLAKGGGIVGAFALPGLPSLAVAPLSATFDAVVGGANPAPAQVTVGQTGGGSQGYTASADSAWLTVTPSAGTIPQVLELTPSIAGLAAGTYTGHVTVTAVGLAGSPVTVTVTLVVASASSGLALDADFSTDNGTPSSSIASPVFSTSRANELVLAFIATDYLTGPNTTVTGVSGAGLAFTLVARANKESGGSEIWRAFAPAPLSAATITATLSGSVVSSMTVVTIAGVDTSGSGGSGAIGAIATAGAASGAPSAQLLTTRNNSWVFGVGNDYDNAIARTPGPSQTVVHEDLTPTGDTYWVQRESAPTPAAGTAVALDDTAPTSDRYNLAICEVLPAP